MQPYYNIKQNDLEYSLQSNEPFISIGQTGTQGYGQEGVFIGMSNDSGSNGTSGILSLTSDDSTGTYNQLAWDGETLLIKGAIRQTAEGVVESRNLGLWDSAPSGFSFRVGDMVSNETISWECILVHVKGVGNDEPGVGSSYTTYWEESNLSAKSLRLSADTQIFRVAQNGTITPSTITLTANRQNIGSSTTYSSSPSITIGGSGDTATITPAQFGSNTAVTFTATAGGFEDEMTIVKLEEGSNALTVVNSNESHTLPTTEAGTVTYAGSGTSIKLFEGDTLLTFKTSSASDGQYNLTVVGNDIVPFNGGNLNSQDGNTIVLFQYVEKHGKVLYPLLEKEGKVVHFIHGSISAEDREEVRRVAESSDNNIILASYGTFSTGVNIKRLDNIIFASPSKSKIRNLQSIGRVLRKSSDDTKATLYDIVDDLQWKSTKNFATKHFMERVKTYNEEGFEFRIYNVSIKG